MEKYYLLHINKQVRILTHDIPKEFIRLLRKSEPLAIYICSPWITEFSNGYMDLIKILSEKKSSIQIFTRPPTNKETHSLLTRIKKETRAHIFVANHLHAKIYVIEGKKDKYVIIGSANFTEEARGNIELAILISNNDLLMKRVIYAFLSYLRPSCRRW